MEFLRKHRWGLVYLLALNLALGVWTLRCSRQTEETVVGEDETPLIAAPRPPLAFVYPTDQRNLLDFDREDVYMPTASGRPESALYGTVRTSRVGNRFLPSFHQGIDIAPLRRDRAGRPRDKVYAVADGTVAYVNRIAGNSNYGIYVVLLHPDPVGEIYTLYAHLARVAPGLKTGDRIVPGEKIGVMGHTSSIRIPRVRAHLHFEIGMVKNMNFPSWYRAQELKPDHGVFHGWNLVGIDPLEIYRNDPDDPVFSMLDYLRSAPAAFEIVLTAPRLPDYFRRYPRLWQGGDFRPGPIVMAFSEGGVPLRGRNATAAESAELRGRASAVLSVNEEALGGNGRRLIVRRGGEWTVGSNGERRLQIYLTP